MKRTCPGTSTKLMPSPPGSVVWAKPRSIVIPRRCSSAKRSGSVPVSQRTSDDLPWSTCPAVASRMVEFTSRPGTGSDRVASTAAQLPVEATTSPPCYDAHRRNAAASCRSSAADTERRSTNVAPSRLRAMTGGSWARSVCEVVAREADGDGRDRRARRRAGTGDRLAVDDLAATGIGGDGVGSGTQPSR